MFGRSSKVAPSPAATPGTPGTPDLSSTRNAAAAGATSPPHGTTGHGSSIVVSCGAAGAFEPRTRLRILIGDGQQSVKWLPRAGRGDRNRRSGSSGSSSRRKYLRSRV